jgi:hypothetical protein
MNSQTISDYKFIYSADDNKVSLQLPFYSTLVEVFSLIKNEISGLLDSSPATSGTS